MKRILNSTLFFAALITLLLTNSHSALAALDTTVVYHGSRDKKKVALTFDADMTKFMEKKLKEGIVKSWYNKDVINILEDTNTPATLFMTGMWMETYPSETKRLASDPLFELENHSYSHPSFAGHCYKLRQIPTSLDSEEIDKTEKILSKVGVKNTYFRFPGGCFDKPSLNIVQKMHLIPIQWDVESGDAFNKNVTKIEKHVINKTRNGSIIVMHLNGGPNAPATALALPTIISELKKKGFEFVKLSDLL